MKTTFPLFLVVALNLLAGCVSDSPQIQKTSVTGYPRNFTENKWWFGTVRDRVQSCWKRPVSSSQKGQSFETRVRLKMDRSGRITDARIVKSSGNATMDDSVMTAVQRVSQVDPLPKGLGDADGYQVNLEFKLIP